MATTTTATNLRVMSYNIHHAEAMDGSVSAAAIAAVVTDSGADLVGLQEVDCLAARTGGVDFIAEFERLTGLHAVFGDNIGLPPSPRGRYGNAILSRYPITRWANHPLPQLQPGGEQRGAMWATVELPGGAPLTFATTHLDHRDAAERAHSCAALRELLGGTGAPLILCGDFNATPHSAELTALSGWGLLDVWESAASADPGFTIPSPEPRSRIDYILLEESAGLSVDKAHVPRTQASDHLPVVADIAVAKPRAAALRVGTYNVLGLTGFPAPAAAAALGPDLGSDAHIRHFAGVFAQLRCDILCLEEGVGLDIIQRVAAKLPGNTHVASFPSPMSWPVGSGCVGHVLTRFPILESRTFSHHTAGVVADESPFSRTAGAALLDLGDELLWMVVVHLHPGNAEMRRQEGELLLAKLRELLEVSPNVLVAGDFNCRVEEPVHDGLKGLGFVNTQEAAGAHGLQPTMDTLGLSPGASESLGAIDHVYASPPLADSVAWSEVVRRSGFRRDAETDGDGGKAWAHSDHLPVVAGLNWPAARTSL